MKYSFIFFILIFFCISCSSTQGDSGKSVKVHTVSSETSLQEMVDMSLSQSKTPILYFTAGWCRPCKEFKKTLKTNQVAKAFGNGMLLSVDVDENPSLASEYAVRAVPTFMKLDKDLNVLAQITSAKWGQSTPGNVAKVMDKLINKTDYDKK